MRLITKKQRTDLQAYEINSRTAKGWSREDYKSLIILKKDEPGNFSLFILRGTAAHPIANTLSRTAERRDENAEQYKRGEDSREKYKEEAKKDKTKSTAANCAAAIRAELAKAFPGVKFTVRSDNFSMGDSVDIGWQDGPTTKQVDEVTGKYEYGHFDGMQDMYINSNSRDDIPQAKFVQTGRRMSEETSKAIEAATATMVEGEGWEQDRRRQEIGRELWYNTPIKVGAKVTGIGRTEENAGSIKDIYRLIIEGGEETAATIQAESPAGTVQIIEHPKKAGKVLVIGETYAIKGKLKELGGRWNKFEKGWEYDRSELERIAKALQPEDKNKPTAEGEAMTATTVPGCKEYIPAHRIPTSEEVESTTPDEIEAPEGQDEAKTHYYKETGSFEDSLPTEKGHDPRNPEEEETPRTYKRSQAENDKASKTLQATAEETRERLRYAEQYTPHKVEQYRERLQEISAPRMTAHAETKQMFLF